MIDFQHRGKQLLLKPIASPFLPLFALTKLLEPGGADAYWTALLGASAVLFMIGDDIQEALQDP